MNAFEIQGKTALVTGANRGIGLAFVKHLLTHGANKVYAGIRNPEFKTFADDFDREDRERLQIVILDVTRQDQIRDFKESVGALDILVNNAGIVNISEPAQDDIVQIARQEMECHYFGPLALTQALLPILKQSEQAAIINISSIAGISSFPGLCSYSASKAAIHSLTQALRLELSNHNVQAIGVYPGPTDTRMAQGDIEKGTPANVAACSFNALSSDDVSVFPDDFAKNMYNTFLQHPYELEKAFADFHVDPVEQ